VAVKRLKVTAGEPAHRELKIADQLAHRSFENWVAVLDAGKDPDTGAYFVVMPQTEKSLAEALRGTGTLSSLDAASVLLRDRIR
jgi:hypothetical protein